MHTRQIALRCNYDADKFSCGTLMAENSIGLCGQESAYGSSKEDDADLAYVWKFLV